MQLIIGRERLSVDDFAEVLRASELSSRRPINDMARLQRMLDGSNLVVTARLDHTNRIVGVVRCLTDWSYACYISDLAVASEFQRGGIGQRLLSEVRTLVGAECSCILVSAPDAVGFYERVGMPRANDAFVFPRRR